MTRVDVGNGLAPIRRTPLQLRRIDATALVRSRLTRPYRAKCRLPSGEEAELLLQLDTGAPVRADDGLTLSTRFGPAVAFDYGPLLLACCSVDVDGAPASCVRVALARYGFAALAPALQAALGEPTVCEAPPDAALREPMVGLHVRFRLPSIRLAMRLRFSAIGMHALLDGGAWHRVDAPASLPAWLTQARAFVPLLVGVTMLPMADYRMLTRGDIVRVDACQFDVTGRTVLRFAGRRLHLCWLDAQRCFEVQTMSDDTPSADPETVPATVPEIAPETDESATGASLSIELSAIPIRLSFSLGMLTLTVGEISEIGAGSLLPLERGLPPQVKIEAHGVPVGAGELVDLDGRLAVQITHWPHDGATPPQS
jgi:type III secretion protein Q